MKVVLHLSVKLFQRLSRSPRSGLLVRPSDTSNLTKADRTALMHDVQTWSGEIQR